MLSVVVVSVLATTGYGIFETMFQSRATNQQMVEKLDTMINLATLAFSNPVWNFNRQAIEETGTAFFQDIEIGAIQLVSKNGEVLFETHKYGVAYENTPLLTKTQIVYSTDQEEIASVTIGMTTYFRELNLRNNNIRFALSMLMVLAAQALVITLLSRSIVKPLLELTHRTRIIANGELDQRIEIISGDEVGDLAIAFNHMANQLETMIYERNEAFNNLENANVELEITVTERTQELSIVNQQLARVEKMAAMTQLLSGVAHEINTPVGVCISSVSYLKKVEEQLRQLYFSGKMTNSDILGFFEESFEAIEIIDKSLDKSVRLMDTLKLSTGEAQFESKYSFNVAQSIQDVISRCQIEFQVNYQVKVSCASDLVFWGNQNTFNHILYSLVANTITHGFAGTEKNEINIIVEDQDKSIRVTISDNGKGMTSEILSNIFNPFFTTTRGKGSLGLGLFAVYEIITLQFNGEVTCSSSLDNGTSFILEFPKYESTT